MKTNLKGSLYVLGGAVSYGILATIVKSANHAGIHTSVLTFMQFFTGVFFLLIYTRFQSKKEPVTPVRTQTSSIARLLVFGTTLGFTSALYYLSIQYIPVSLGIILLMQSIWMSILLELILTRQRIKPIKILATALVLAGTLLATNILFQHTAINWTGIWIGLGAALSYTISMYASSHVEGQLPSYTRSKYLVLGGFIAILFFWNIDIIRHFNTIDILWWGIVLGIFGTILPPLLFTKGIPLIGIGSGSIIASIEIPVSILCAHFVLGEHMDAIQWIGVVVIILSVILANSKSANRSRNNDLSL